MKTIQRVVLRACCTYLQYNTLKMLRHLFRWQPAASLCDDYEIKLINGILGVQQPGVVGSLSYMTPLGRGVNRNKWDWYGFGKHNNSFWCCYGTTIEQFAKLGDSIYFKSVADTASKTSAGTLYVAQFIASTLQLEAGTVVTQKTKLSTQTGSNGGAMAVLAVNLTVSVEDRSNAASFGSGAKTFNMKVRAPGWAAEGSTLVVLRAGHVLVPSSSTEATYPVVPGTFIDVVAPSGGWQGGDVVSGSFAMTPRLKPINDKRPAYKNVVSTQGYSDYN